ncbi:MAG: hypothetical protein HY752_07525 [Nitrospirae bacterium]|nr:hypothetical protein [Nitrospirota bacterium]
MLQHKKMFALYNLVQGVAVLMLIVFTSYGCSGKGKVKPSDDSLITQDVIRVTNVIKTAYEEKDWDTLKDNISSEFAKNIMEWLFFDKAELSFTPRMVKITEPKVMVNLNWQGRWIIKDKTIKNRGVGILVFQRKSMKLIEIEGDNPFQTPLSEK